MKPEIRAPGNYVKKDRPRRNFGKNLSYPLPWNFNRVHLCYLEWSVSKGIWCKINESRQIVNMGIKTGTVQNNFINKRHFKINNNKTITTTTTTTNMV